jgi:hypothetical protein
MANIKKDEIILFLENLKIKNNYNLVSSIEDIDIKNNLIQIVLNVDEKEKEDIEVAAKIWQRELSNQLSLAT